MNNYFRVFKFFYFKCNFLDYTCPIRLVWALFFIRSLLCAFLGFWGFLVAFWFFLFSVFFCFVVFLFILCFCSFLLLCFCGMFYCFVVGHFSVLLYLFFFVKGIYIFIFIVVVWSQFLDDVWGNIRNIRNINFFYVFYVFFCI